MFRFLFYAALSADLVQVLVKLVVYEWILCKPETDRGIIPQSVGA
jgi:hypothetical protein